MEEILSGNRWEIRKIELDLKVNNSDLIKDRSFFRKLGDEGRRKKAITKGEAMCTLGKPAAYRGLLGFED